MSGYPAGAGYPSRRSVLVECRNDECTGREPADSLGGRFYSGRQRWTGVLRDNGLGFTELLYPTNQCPECGDTNVEIDP